MNRLSENVIPRRCDLHRLTPAELAIYKAACEVESLGAHPLLTDSVSKLAEARKHLADYVDQIQISSG